MSGARKVVGWVSWDEAQSRPKAVGGLGGWFEDGQRWADYLDIWQEGAHPYLEAIREAVLEGEIKRGGFWHQAEGCPVFDDGTAASFSMRAWGDLLAAIWSEAEGRDHNYCHFAWED